MSAIAEIVGAETVAMMEVAMDKAAEKSTGYVRYSGSAAMKKYNISRSELRHITPTVPPNRKPVYLAKHIEAYLDQITIIR